VEGAVHERVVSDTIKARNFDLSRKLKCMEQKLFEEAEFYEIDVRAIRTEIDAEFKAWQKLLNKDQKKSRPSQPLKLKLNKNSLYGSRKGEDKDKSNTAVSGDDSESSQKSEKGLFAQRNQKKPDTPQKFSSRVELVADTPKASGLPGGGIQKSKLLRSRTLTRTEKTGNKGNGLSFADQDEMTGFEFS
jgi:hypothetical protein